MGNEVHPQKDCLECRVIGTTVCVGKGSREGTGGKRLCGCARVCERVCVSDVIPQPRTSREEKIVCIRLTKDCALCASMKEHPPGRIERRHRVRPLGRTRSSADSQIRHGGFRLRFLRHGCVSGAHVRSGLLQLDTKQSAHHHPTTPTLSLLTKTLAHTRGEGERLARAMAFAGPLMGPSLAGLRGGGKREK